MVKFGMLSPWDQEYSRDVYSTTVIQTFIQVSMSVGQRIKVCRSKRKRMTDYLCRKSTKIYKNSPRIFNKWVYQVLGIPNQHMEINCIFKCCLSSLHINYLAMHLTKYLRKLRADHYKRVMKEIQET